MNDGPVPERRFRLILPFGPAGIENGVIPIKAFVEAAGRCRLGRLLFHDLVQSASDKVIRIPKLARSSIGHALQSAAGRRPPIGGENRLPDNQDAKVAVALARQKLLGCGGPPQTSGSSGRHKEEDARSVGSGVEGIFELCKICVGKGNQGLLPRGDGSRTPQVKDRQNDENGDYDDDAEPSQFHFGVT